MKSHSPHIPTVTKIAEPDPMTDRARCLEAMIWLAGIAATVLGVIYYR